MFQITEMTEAHVASVTNRTEANGDERVPAVSIGLEMTVPNTMLDLIDASIRHALYKAVEGQDELPGVDPATPVLRCNSFDSVSLVTSHEGWALKVDDGVPSRLQASGERRDGLAPAWQRGVPAGGGGPDPGAQGGGVRFNVEVGR